MINKKQIIQTNKIINLELQSVFGIISHIENNYKNIDSHVSFLLLNTIYQYLITNNKETTLYTIRNTINNNAKELIKNNDILELFYKENINNNFKIEYEKLYVYINTKEYSKLDIYCKVLEQIDLFIQIGEQYEE